MIKIKLKRGGSTHDAHFKVVVINSNKVGFILDSVGHYHPKIQGEGRVFFNAEKLQGWVSNGAQLTPTVAKLASNYGIEVARKFQKTFSPRQSGEFKKNKKK